MQVIKRNQVYLNSANVSTDTTVIIKDQMLNKMFTFCFKTTIKWNLIKSHPARLKSTKYKTRVIKRTPPKMYNKQTDEPILRLII